MKTFKISLIGLGTRFYGRLFRNGNEWRIETLKKIRIMRLNHVMIADAVFLYDIDMGDKTTIKNIPVSNKWPSLVPFCVLGNVSLL